VTVGKLGRLIEEEGDAVNQTFYAMLQEAQEEAMVHGPDSEGARAVDMIAALLYSTTAAVILDAPPTSGEPVFSFPAEDGDPARGRVVFRIGAGHLAAFNGC
jgi:hypothetical protein